MVKIFEKVPASSLFVSEPNPAMFGNPANPPKNKQESMGWSPQSKNWLKSRFHFAFAEHFNGPRAFSSLRVMNDDLVQPSTGFGTHPHRNAEIATFVIDGELQHADSMSNKETLGRGAIQYLSAASGITHSEKNAHRSKHCRFIQIWITPNRYDIDPQYGSMKPRPQQRKNKFDHVIAPWEASEVDTPIKLHADVNFFLAEVDPGKQVSLPLAEGRQAYVLQVEGGATVSSNAAPDSVQLEQQDAVKMWSRGANHEITFSAEGEKPALILAVELKEE